MRLLTVGVGLFLFCLLLGLSSSYWVVLSSHDMRVYAYSYCILLCHVQLIILLLSEEKETENQIWGRQDRGHKDGEE